LVSEPQPVSNKVPKVTGSEDQGESPHHHTAHQQQNKKDSLEISDQAKKEVQKRPEVELPTQSKPDTEGLRREDHFNGLF